MATAIARASVGGCYCCCRHLLLLLLLAHCSGIHQALYHGTDQEGVTVGLIRVLAKVDSLGVTQSANRRTSAISQGDPPALVRIRRGAVRVEVAYLELHQRRITTRNPGPLFPSCVFRFVQQKFVATRVRLVHRFQLPAAHGIR
uniref:Putative secreted protein n=1 Tax=Anopheles triannulatus TaxID=58253 RepID=A0A2M4B2Q0_9DIPT